MAEIYLIDYVIEGKDGSYRAFPVGDNSHIAPFMFKARQTELPPHGHVAIERIFEGGKHSVVASAEDMDEADGLAYDTLIEELAWSVRNNLYDIQSGSEELAVCFLPVEDRTPYNNGNIHDEIFTHLRASSESGDIRKDLVEMYEAAALERIAQVTAS